LGTFSDAMIDLHVHILHSLDDGPQTQAESLEMCKIAYRDGIRTVVATPHFLNGVYRNDWATVLARVKALNESLHPWPFQEAKTAEACSPVSRPWSNASSVGSPPVSRKTGSIPQTCNSGAPFQVLPGADVHFRSDILQLYEQGRLGTINNQGKFLLIEFSSQEVPLKTEELFFQLVTKGITPIITHPERNYEIMRKPERYYELIRRGCLGQLTAMSLTNGFGSEIRKFAEKLLSHRLVHLIASDAHSVNGRPPILSASVKAAAKIVGEKEALKMVTEYPHEILDGLRPMVLEPIPLR
jgi:protein-tyrosine phosphatase